MYGNYDLSNCFISSASGGEKRDTKNQQFESSIKITSLKPLALLILLGGVGDVGGVERLPVAGFGGGASPRRRLLLVPFVSNVHNDSSREMSKFSGFFLAIQSRVPIIGWRFRRIV